MEILMKDIELIFACVHLLCHKSHKTNVNCGGSYIDSLNWT